MFSGSKWGFLRTASSIVIFSTPLGVIFKVKRSYFKVKIVIFDHFISFFTSIRARNKISGSKWGFLRMASSIMTFSTPLGVFFKVKRSYFKFKIVNFGHFSSFFILEGLETRFLA